MATQPSTTMMRRVIGERLPPPPSSHSCLKLRTGSGRPSYILTTLKRSVVPRILSKHTHANSFLINHIQKMSSKFVPEQFLEIIFWNLTRSIQQQVSKYNRLYLSKVNKFKEQLNNGELPYEMAHNAATDLHVATLTPLHDVLYLLKMLERHHPGARVLFNGLPINRMYQLPGLPPSHYRYLRAAIELDWLNNRLPVQELKGGMSETNPLLVLRSLPHIEVILPEQPTCRQEGQPPHKRPRLDPLAPTLTTLPVQQLLADLALI